jgi:thiamine kinase-like enzyme
MIYEITKVLVRTGLAENGAAVDVWQLVRRHKLSAFCHVAPLGPVVVKVSAADSAGHCDSLERELNALNRLSGILGGHLSKSFALETQQGLTFLVLRFEEFTTLTYSQGGAPTALSRKWLTLIKHFYENAPESPHADRPSLYHFLEITHPHLVEKWNNVFAQPGHILQQRVAQHGDFTINNLGHLQDTQPFILDWEDYGLVDLPGFDMATLLASMANFDRPTLTKDYLSETGQHHLATKKLVAAAGVNWSEFTDALPLYLAAFHWLKRKGQYSASIDLMLHEMLRQ